MATRAEASACKRDKVEQYLSCAGSMTASTWCRLNHVKSSTFYEWLAHFGDTESEMFGGYEIAHADDGKRRWFEEVRKTMAASRALAPVPRHASFAIVDTADLAPAPRACAAAGRGRHRAERRRRGAHHPQRDLRGRHICGPEGGEVAVDPFTCPDK